MRSRPESALPSPPIDYKPTCPHAATGNPTELMAQTTVGRLRKNPFSRFRSLNRMSPECCLGGVLCQGTRRRNNKKKRQGEWRWYNCLRSVNGQSLKPPQADCLTAAAYLKNPVKTLLGRYFKMTQCGITRGTENWDKSIQKEKNQIEHLLIGGRCC